MSGREILNTIMQDSNLSQAGLARELGISAAALWDRTNMKKTTNISTAVLSQMLCPLGYKLVVVPEDTPLPEDAYIVT